MVGREALWRVLWLIGIVIVAVVALGLYGVFGPVQHVSAADRTDDACMLALKRRSVPYAERVTRCRVRVVNAVMPSSNGYWRWRTGNELWRFWTEVTWKPVMVNPTQFSWRIDDVNCWKDYVYIVGLDITDCKKWWVNGVHYGGASYVVSFGPVAEGARTYITVRSSGASDGVFYD